MVTFAIIVAVLLAIKLGHDWTAKNKEHRIINHARSAMIDGFLYLVSGVILFDWDWMIILGAFICAIGVRWLLFDILFNLLNKDKWDHYGTSSVLDKFLTKLDKYHLLPKIILILIGINILVWA